jgi:hypothetical protein
MSENEQYICKGCGVICEERDGQWLHPEPWATIKRGRIEHCQGITPVRPASAREREAGGIRSVRRDRWMYERQLATLAQPEGSPIEVATVGCYAYLDSAPDSRTYHPRGWGYVASDGRFGCGATTTTRRYDGPGEIAAELRALFWASRKLIPRHPTTIVTDYPEIVDLVQAWRSGAVDTYPAEYNSDRRAGGHEAKLAVLARLVFEHEATVSTRLVEDYAETPGGVAADKLAQLGWKWAAGKQTKQVVRQKAVEIVAGTFDVEPTLAVTDETQTELIRGKDPSMPSVDESQFDGSTEEDDDLL